MVFGLAHFLVEVGGGGRGGISRVGGWGARAQRDDGATMHIEALLRIPYIRPAEVAEQHFTVCFDPVNGRPSRTLKNEGVLGRGRGQGRASRGGEGGNGGTEVQEPHEQTTHMQPHPAVPYTVQGKRHGRFPQ